MPLVASGRSWDLFQGDACEVLRSLSSGSVNSIITSPAYYWQRDYEVDGQFGQEPTIEAYVENLRATFAEAKRVLADDGTLWLNLGDTYYSAKGRPHGEDRKHRKRRMVPLRAVDGPGLGLPRKSLIGIPWRVAFALQQDGWVLRAPIVWVRNTAVPEPTGKDRPWRKYEFVFLFSKSPRYHFDRAGLAGEEDVWTIEPDRRARASGIHYAPYPRALVERCIRAGCPEGGTVLDPFVGGGTTMYVAQEMGRSSIGIDLSADFCEFVAAEMSRTEAALCPGLGRKRVFADLAGGGRMPGRSPESIARWLDLNLFKFDGPGQFLGTEPNAARRPWDGAQVRWLLAASWDYSQAAGNMAVPAVYDAVHKAGVYTLADRFYLPATPRDMDLLERGQVPVFGIESRHQARDFDVFATSISYTVLFMNFCKFLTMSGIPLRWSDRAPGDYPMVMVGGQAYCAPEFMAPVVDCVWLGEAEDEEGNPGIGAVCERIAQFKRDGTWSGDREGCYLALAREFNFLYFPRYTGVAYHYEDRGLPELTKMVSGYQPLHGLPARFKARRVADLNKADLMTSAPVLFSDPGMGSGDIEVQRGCPAWCVFCRIGWVTKPPRQESVPRTAARARTWRDAMGSAGISLVAPDPPMHTQKKKLIAELLEQVTGRVDSSSMRIDDYISDPGFSLLLQVSGATSLTLGLEGNSQRMRDLAGKGTSDDDVAEAVTRAIRAGIRKIKLYFITNWPGEEQADVMRIVELGKRLADIRDSFGEAAAGVQIIFSWTPLLIEAQTPLQWFEVTPPDYMLQAALDELREHRIWIKIGSKASPPKLAFFQACQRASRDVGEAIVDVIENYGSASWGGFPKDMRERLDDALVAHGFRNGLDDVFGERFYEDLLGWEMIDTGVSRSLMWRAYRDMVEFLEGTSAETYDSDIPEGYHGNEWVPRCDQQCSGNACGVCDRADLELRRIYVQAVDRDLAREPARPLDQSTVAQRVRMRVTRPEEFRFVSSTSLEYIVRRAAFRAHRDGFPALAVASVGFASSGTGYRERSAGTDYAEFGLTRVADSFDIGDYLTRMAVHLHPHLHWGGNYAVLSAAAKLPARPVSLWELEVADDPAVLAKRLRWWGGAQSVPVLIRADSFYAGATTAEGDAKGHVADFWLARDGQRTMLRMLLNGRLGPYQAYAALAGKASWLDAARFTARRLEFFHGGVQQCEGCGHPVPASLLDVPWSERYCPRCGDEAEGKIIAALTGVGVLQVLTPVEEPVDGPGYRKPTHSYGQTFGSSPDTSDENWAGQGYTEIPGPEVLEPVDQPA